MSMIDLPLSTSRRSALAQWCACLSVGPWFAATIHAAQDEVDVADPLRRFLAESIGRPPAERRALAQRVLVDAEATLKQDPRQTSAHLLRVAALGAIARSVSAAESVANRYGSRSKQALDELLAVVPQLPWALALSGVWNIEVVRRGGFIGASLLGASIGHGESSLRKAIELAPREPGIRFAYAVSLLSFDARTHAEQAKRLLTDARQIAAETTTPLGPPVSQHAGTLLDLLMQDSLAEAGTLALVLM